VPELPDDLVPSDAAWPVVLGIDPGTRVLGWGAVVEAPDGPRFLACGVLTPTASATVAARLHELRTELEDLLAKLRPAAVGIEGAFTGPNVRSALRISEARGVALACTGARACEVHEVPPARAKQAVTGNGNASKEQVARMIAAMFSRREFEVAHDATDALAIAVACVRERQRAVRLR
jgi:crossover junction endodeoxyribonuclease RuvC